MRITELRKEMPMPGQNSIEPDIYVEFDNGEWLTVEVVKSNPPNRAKHEFCKSQMIVLDLRELEFLYDDRAFSKWIQRGGVEKMLRENASLEVRQRRFEERENEWKRKDELEFRAAVKYKISDCQRRFTGIVYTGNEEDFSDLDEIEAWFVEELAKRELRQSIQDAIDANVKRFGEALDRGVDDFSGPEEVNKFYQNHFKERIERERAKKRAAKKQLKADIQAAKNDLEAELGIKIRKHFETMLEFELYAENKRLEKEKERLKEELTPLIVDLEKELNIEVTRKFSDREDFDRYAARMREAYWSRSLKEKTLETYHRMHDEEVMRFSEEYDTYLAEEHSGLSYKKKWDKMDRFLRKAQNELLEWSFSCDVFPTKSLDLCHKLKTGPFVRDIEACLVIDKICQIEGKHRCNRHESELAKGLIQRIKVDMCDPDKGMKTAEERRFEATQPASKSRRKTSRGRTNRKLRKMRSRRSRKKVPKTQQEEVKMEKTKQTETQPEQPSRPTREERLEMSRRYNEQNKAKAPQIDSKNEQEDEDRVVELRRRSEQMKNTAQDILAHNSTDAISEDGVHG